MDTLKSILLNDLWVCSLKYLFIDLEGGLLLCSLYPCKGTLLIPVSSVFLIPGFLLVHINGVMGSQQDAPVQGGD